MASKIAFFAAPWGGRRPAKVPTVPLVARCLRSSPRTAGEELLLAEELAAEAFAFADAFGEAFGDVAFFGEAFGGEAFGDVAFFRAAFGDAAFFGEAFGDAALGDATCFDAVLGDAAFFGDSFGDAPAFIGTGAASAPTFCFFAAGCEGQRTERGGVFGEATSLGEI